MLLPSPYPVAGPCPILLCGEVHAGHSGAQFGFPVGKQDPSPGVRHKWGFLEMPKATREPVPAARDAHVAPGLSPP